MHKVLLFNPRSANSKPRIPNSILQVAASIHDRFLYFIVDGNLETDPWEKILHYIKTENIQIFGVTVMPGPQLKQAIPFTKKVREEFPHIINVWGGYFASNQPETVLRSGYVDYIVNGPGDSAFPALLDALKDGKDPGDIPNLIFLNENAMVRTAKAALPDLDKLPSLPYQRLNEFYPLQKYLGRTYLGKKTIAYHSSFGCPFTCSFCAVVPIYNARWKGRSAQGIYKDIKFLKDNYGGDAIEFHDNNFFVSEKRAVEFARLIKPENMIWWGEARIDTMDKYSDESLRIIYESGCRMIFFGAETGSDEVLKKMDKGGTQTGEQILSFAGRLKNFGIIPEYSFVLGTPAASDAEVSAQIDADISFIRKVKTVNPQTEIIIYTYSPVPVEGSDMFDQVQASGFRFPQQLEDWISPAWENFDLRKNPLTPWLKPYMIDKIRNFETVLNGYYPTCSDIRLRKLNRAVMRSWSSLRYKTKFYDFPLEIKVMQKLWKYRQPEKEGF